MGVKQYPKSIVRRAARVFAREFAEVLAQQQAEMAAASIDTPVGEGRALIGETPVRIDVVDALQQLSTTQANQALRHFFAWNHRWVALLSERNRRSARDVYDFIEAEMADAVFVLDQFQVLQSRRDEIDAVDGSILDLGVYKGASTRALARIFPDREIHGFDSFEGLPEDWSHALSGGFGEIKGALPDVPDSVRLYKGWFDDTLPPWSKANDGPIALLRIDCDIYSSTKTIFETLGHQIRPGTWIVFDELIGYFGWRDHEYRAFVEYVDESGISYEFVAYGLTYTIVRVTGLGG